MICGRRKYGFGAKSVSRRRFLGADVEEMSPGARVAKALSVIVPVALSGVFLFAFFPGVWWIFTIYGWILFPAFGLLTSGMSGVSEERREAEKSTVTVESKERRLLEALRDHGELTPALASLETSLSVAEAEKILRELAEGGYLEVRAKDGGVFYAMWRRS